MSEYTKPKYKNLLKYLHDRNHYLDVDSFTAENRVELLSNFIMLDTKHTHGGKCFCSKKLKNVFFVDCILTKEPMMVGGGCKSLFTPRNKKKHREQFLNRTLHLFTNNLGWEKIINWNNFIGQSIDSYLRNASSSELLRLQELYKDNHNILDRIDRYFGGVNNNPTYPNFIDDIENDGDMDLYIVNDDYKNYWLKYLRENYHDRNNILTIWYSKNRYVYDYIKPLLEELEKVEEVLENVERPSMYDWFLQRLEQKDLSWKDDENLIYYDGFWNYYLRENYNNRINILTEWNGRNEKVYKYIHEILAKIEKEK